MNVVGRKGCQVRGCDSKVDRVCCLRGGSHDEGFGREVKLLHTSRHRERRSTERRRSQRACCERHPPRKLPTVKHQAERDDRDSLSPFPDVPLLCFAYAEMGFWRVTRG